MPVVQIQISDELMAQIEIVATATDQTPQAIVENAINHHLDHRAALPEFHRIIEPVTGRFTRAIDALYARKP